MPHESEPNSPPIRCSIAVTISSVLGHLSMGFSAIFLTSCRSHVSSGHLDCSDFRCKFFLSSSDSYPNKNYSRHEYSKAVSQ